MSTHTNTGVAMALRSLLAFTSLCSISAYRVPLSEGFIWAADAPQNGYVGFRSELTLPAGSTAASLLIFADSRYILWVNGQDVCRGPVRFHPSAPQYDSINVTQLIQPAPAVNTIAVLVFSYASCLPFTWQSVDATFSNSNPQTEDCWTTWPGSPTPNGRILNHVPGLTLAIISATGEVLFTTSNSSWMGTTATRYTPPLPVWGSIADVIDARLDDFSWRLPGYQYTATWKQAVPVPNAWGPLIPRRIPQLRETSFLPKPMGTNASFPLMIPSGSTVTLQLAQGVQGRAEAWITTKNPGATLLILYFQRFVNGSADVSWGLGTNFTAVGNGEPEYILSADSWGHRYLTVTAVGGNFLVLNFTVTSRLYSFTPFATFDATGPGAAFLSQYFAASVKTVAVVTEDAYEDCAGRERAEWVGDAIFSTAALSRAVMATCEAATTFPAKAGDALCGVGDSATWGDYRLHAELLRRAATSTMTRYPSLNVLKAHTTSDRNDWNGYIEDYAAGWVSSVRDVVDGGGDDDGLLLPFLWPTVRSVLNRFLGQVTELGLVLGREFLGVGNPVGYTVTQGTTLNSVVLKALLDGSYLASLLNKTTDQTGWSTAAANLQAAIVAQLFDAETGSFSAAIDADGTRHPPSQVAAFTAIASGVLESPAPYPTQFAATFSWMLQNDAIAAITCPYQSAWMLRALFDHGEAAIAAGTVVSGGVPALDTLALNIIRTRFPAVLVQDTDTTSEMFNGGDFQHQMGATAAYFLPTRVLGVRCPPPSTQLHLLVEPHLGDLLQASGTVATDLGPVSVAWDITGGNGNSLPWGFGSPRAVTFALNFTLANIPESPTYRISAASSNVTTIIALPLADPWTTPPASLASLLLQVDAWPAVNISSVLGSGGNLPYGLGTLSLDPGAWYLRVALPPYSPTIGTGLDITGRLYCGT
jgi:alpha-L-rhamnosidase